MVVVDPLIPSRLEMPFQADLMTLYPLPDFHLGMYSWKEETGEDFDLYIARDLLRDTMGTLMGMGPDSETGIILNLGDYFHSDSNENRTRRSGAALDVDTRYAKVLDFGSKLMVDVVGMALQKHPRVILRNIPGNHDPYATIALTAIMQAFFRNEPRVTVDPDPGPFWWYKHGKVLLGATHGDMAKPEKMPAIMAAKQSEAWGQTKFRYNYIGHFHTVRAGGEDGGAYWEVLDTIAPKDAWNNQMGFLSGRRLQSISHDAEKGEVVRLTVPVIGGPK